MNKLLLGTMIILFPICIQAQNLINGDLEGIKQGPSTLPDFWEAVPYTDPDCQAWNTAYATPDLTGEFGPFLHTGIAGLPYSGETFVSGLLFEGVVPGAIWHEGIQQLVSGFTPNETYQISFFQSVVKQNNGDNYEYAIDTSGSWSVYLDDQLVGATVPSVSLLPFDEVVLDWDFRSLTFTATQESHTLKFLPSDDDLVSNSYDENGGIRMGIDFIQLGIVSDINDVNYNLLIKVFPNPFTDLLSIELDQFYQNVRVEILNTQGQVVVNFFYTDIDKLELPLNSSKGLYLLRVILNEEICIVKRVWKE